MKYNVLIHPIYLFDDLSLSMHGIPRFDKYEIFKIISIFDKIYVDKKWFLDIVSSFSKDNILINSFNQLFKEDIMIDAPFEEILLDYINKKDKSVNIECGRYYNSRFHGQIKIGMLRRIHETTSRVADSVEMLPLESIRTHLLYSFDNNCLPLVNMPDLLVCFASKLEKERTEELKKRIKFWYIAKYMFNICIPSLEIKTNKDFEKFIAIRESGIKMIQTKVSNFVNNFGGYVLRENEQKKIKDYITTSEMELFKIKKLFNGISLGIDVISDFTSFMTILPVGTVKTILTKLIENKQIKSKNLEWLIYLQSLKALQTDDIKTRKCGLCNISLAEIESLTDSEVNLYLHGDICTAHMVIILNLRKITGTYGRDLLKLIKENENNKDLNLYTPLGTE